jgi:HAMP domain-containing protein
MTPLLQIVADTLIVRQVSPDRVGFDQVVFVTAGLAQIVTLVVVVLLAVIFFRMWKAQQAMQEQLGRLTSKIDPMIASATSAAENVRELTDAVKQDAMAAAEALSNATARVRDSVSGIADRIDEFGDLLGRVTDKAEAVADVAGAAVSTLKAGTRLFKRDEHPNRHGEPRHRRDEHRRDEHLRDEHRRDEHRREEPRREEPRRDAPHREAARSDAPVRLEERPTATSDDDLDEPIRLTDDEDGHESPYAEEAGGVGGAGAAGDASRPPRPKRRRNRRRRGGGGPGGAGGASDGGPQSPP